MVSRFAQFKKLSQNDIKNLQKTVLKNDVKMMKKTSKNGSNMEVKSGKMTSKNRCQKLMRKNAKKAPPRLRAGSLRWTPRDIQINKINYLLNKFNIYKKKIIGGGNLKREKCKGRILKR